MVTAFSTLSLVDTETFSGLLKALETVAVDTPAIAAIFFIVLIVKFFSNFYSMNNWQIDYGIWNEGLKLIFSLLDFQQIDVM
ncbi:Conserved hypothetical protein [Candidatus Hamiltonella defensa (Bemisia tabaci)]|nr:Conserved hypothetical protein [Candidatus Hamiltonella defensa (Bemisia tabaci)]